MNTPGNQLAELYQTEWCPSSHRVRTRLTELGIDVIIHQVEPEPEQRDELFDRTGTRGVPTLLADGSTYAGVDEILEYLDTTWQGAPEPPSVAAHRDKAERVRIKQLEKGSQIA